MWLYDWFAFGEDRTRGHAERRVENVEDNWELIETSPEEYDVMFLESWLFNSTEDQVELNSSEVAEKPNSHSCTDKPALLAPVSSRKRMSKQARRFARRQNQKGLSSCRRLSTVF